MKNLRRKIGIKGTDNEKNALGADCGKILARVMKGVCSEKERRRIRARKRLLKAALAAAVILALGGAGTLAARGWNAQLAKYFGMGQEQMEQLSESTAFPQVSAKNGGISVTVTQTIADSHGIYVLYDVSGIGGIKPGDNLSWKSARLGIKYGDADKKPGLGGYAYNKVLGIKDGTCTMLYIRTGTGKIANQRLTFELSGLQKAAEGNNFTLISDGGFRLEWDFEYKNCGKSYKPNRALRGGKNVLTQADISPISAWITLKGDEFDGEAALELENGEKIPVSGNAGYSPLYGGVNTISCEFDRIIEPDKVKAIIIGKETVPL